MKTWIWNILDLCIFCKKTSLSSFMASLTGHVCVPERFNDTLETITAARVWTLWSGLFLLSIENSLPFLVAVLDDDMLPRTPQLPCGLRKLKTKPNLGNFYRSSCHPFSEIEQNQTSCSTRFPNKQDKLDITVHLYWKA